MVVIQEGADVIVEGAVRKPRKHGVLTIVARREQASHCCPSRDPVEIIVKYNEPEHALVRSVGLARQTIAEMAVAALGIRMARFFLDLPGGHRKLRIAELRHAFFVRMALDALVARLVAGIKIGEYKHQEELRQQDRHPAPVPEPLP